MTYILGEIIVCSNGTITHPLELCNFPFREDVLDAEQLAKLNQECFIDARLREVRAGRLGG